jgi:hypothetical protein
MQQTSNSLSWGECSTSKSEAAVAPVENARSATERVGFPFKSLDEKRNRCDPGSTEREVCKRVLSIHYIFRGG